jgi:phosphate transport system ATP-binding protein
MGEQQSRQSASFGGVEARSAATINVPRIAIRNLDFFYGDNRALKKVKLDLSDRQVTGMIGPSGCASRRCCAC